MTNEENDNKINNIDANSIEIEKNKIIDNKYKQMRGLTTYKNLDETKLRDLAKQKLLSSVADLEIASLFSDKKEVLIARKLLGKYLQDYTPASVSDKNNLRHLIYLEIIQVRLQEKMNEMNAKSNAIPLQMLDSIHKNLREINDLKLKLGLVGEKREESRNDAFKAWDLLKDKFKRWREENQGSRTLVCPHCGKMVMLKIRIDAWEAAKHPYFKDRILTNRHLIRLYNENKVNRADVASILECSENYVDWLVEKWNKIYLTDEKKEKQLNIEETVGEEKEEELSMLMSEEKRKRENRCPQCETGYLACRIAEDGSQKWEEHCTSCEYHKIYVNRREKQEAIDFPDRRKAPSSLKEEEKEN